MNEQIQMTDGELSEVRTLQDKFQQKIFQLGQLTLQKLQATKALKQLSDQEITCEGDWISLQEEERQLIEVLLKKYGEGTLDLKAGMFIVDSKK